MVRGRFAVPMQTSSISLFNRCSNKSYISLDSQRIMLYHDMHYVDVENEIEVQTKREFKTCNFQQYFLNLNILVINGLNFTKYETPVVEGHSEGTVSQIFHLGPRFYFMKSRKLGCKKWQNVSPFLPKNKN